MHMQIACATAIHRVRMTWSSSAWNTKAIKSPGAMKNSMPLSVNLSLCRQLSSENVPSSSFIRRFLSVDRANATNHQRTLVSVIEMPLDSKRFQLRLIGNRVSTAESSHPLPTDHSRSPGRRCRGEEWAFLQEHPFNPLTWVSESVSNDLRIVHGNLIGLLGASSTPNVPETGSSTVSSVISSQDSYESVNFEHCYLHFVSCCTVFAMVAW